MSCKEREIIGLTVKVNINGKNIIAKVDTGADSSSIDKTIVENLNKPIIKYKKIKSALGYEKRGVIKLNFMINDKEFNDYFTVSDRSNLKYKVLIGKDILKKEKFLIDPTKI